MTANEESFAKNAFKTRYGAGNCGRRNVQLFRRSERAFVPGSRSEVDEMTERDPRQPNWFSPEVTSEKASLKESTILPIYALTARTGLKATALPNLTRKATFMPVNNALTIWRGCAAAPHITLVGNFPDENERPDDHSGE